MLALAKSRWRSHSFKVSLFSLPRILPRTMFGVRSVVASGARSITLDGTRFLKVHAAEGGAAAGSRLVRPALSSSFSLSLLSRDNTARCYSVSPFVNRTVEGVGGNDGKPSTHMAAGPTGGSTTHTFFVQRRGAVGFAKLVTAAVDVGDLLEEIAKKLKLDVALDTITLQLATSKELPGRLNSMDTVDEALRKALGRAATSEEKLRLIVDVAAATPNPLGVKGGESCVDVAASRQSAQSLPRSSLSLLLLSPAGRKITAFARAPGGQSVPAPGALPYDAALGIPPDVWATMASSAQVAAQSAGKHRALLSRLPMLRDLQPGISANAAQKLGIQMIREDEAGAMAVGSFEVPQIPADIAEPPKTFEQLSERPHQLLVLPQRLRCALEFVDAVSNRSKGYGVLLSGPNGVGKSGIGLLSYLLCVARRLPVVYISRCEDWVQKASSIEGGGHEFFLKALWRQNADVIAATPALRSVFSAALRGDGSPFTAAVMEALQLAVAARDGPQLGVIMDEVQHITQAVAKVRGVPTSSVPRQLAGDFFATTWHDWTNRNFVFPRLSIASAHGERELKLPDGEQHRIVIVEPLDSKDTAALQTSPLSPAFVFDDPDTRGRVVYMAGNVLRKLVLAASILPRDRAPTESDLQDVWRTLWPSMVENCSDWLSSLPEQERKACARQVRTLLRGELEWSTAKPLYDAGIVYRTAGTALVHPVSALAAAVILHVTAEYVRGHPEDIRLIADGRWRGFALEDQLFSFINPINQLVPAKLLDGTDGPAVHLKCKYAVTFKSLEEVVSKSVPVLYLPDSGTYPCDGILMPAAGDADGEITLVEASTEDPRTVKRVKKVLKWYRPGPKQPREGDPVATVLKGRYPNRPLVVALCYDKELPKATGPLDGAISSLSRGEWLDDGDSTSKASAPLGGNGTGAGVPDAPALQVPDAPALQVPDAPALQVPDAPALQVPDAPALQVPGAPAPQVPAPPITSTVVGSQVRVLDAHCLRNLGLVL
jgi:hypothetical protein